MAYRLFGIKPLSEPMLVCCELDMNQNTTIRIKENAIENIVCKMVTILSGLDVLKIKHFTICRWYPAKRALPAMLTHDR